MPTTAEVKAIQPVVKVVPMSPSCFIVYLKNFSSVWTHERAFSSLAEAEKYANDYKQKIIDAEARHKKDLEFQKANPPIYY